MDYVQDVVEKLFPVLERYNDLLKLTGRHFERSQVTSFYRLELRHAEEDVAGSVAEMEDDDVHERVPCFLDRLGLVATILLLESLPNAAHRYFLHGLGPILDEPRKLCNKSRICALEGKPGENELQMRRLVYVYLRITEFF